MAWPGTVLCPALTGGWGTLCNAVVSGRGTVVSVAHHGHLGKPNKRIFSFISCIASSNQLFFFYRILVELKKFPLNLIKVNIEEGLKYLNKK